MNSSSDVENSAAAGNPVRRAGAVWWVAAVLLGLLVACLVALAATALWLQPDAVNGGVLAAVVAVPTALVVLARRKALGRGVAVGVGYLLVGAVVAYLAADDGTLRRNVMIDQFSPAFPGAEMSYEVLMRYGKQHPLGRDFKAPDRIFTGQGPRFVGDITKSEEWRTWLLAHRADIEADWADLAPVRAWWSELAQFDRIADLMPARFDGEIISFAPIRSYTQHAIDIAGLQALDGHGDESFATLQLVAEVSRRLEPSARTLVRIMIARVAQKMTVEAAAFVLDHTTVSAAARARLAAALMAGTGGEEGARRLIGVEYVLYSGGIVHMPAGDIIADEGESIFGGPFMRWAVTRVALNFVSRTVFNPIASLNTGGELNARLQELAMHRQTDQMQPCAETFFKTGGAPRMKNLCGRIFVRASVPTLAEIAASYWRIEDERTTLLTRLKQQPG